jgi:hypothetical protein
MEQIVLQPSLWPFGSGPQAVQVDELWVMETIKALKKLHMIVIFTLDPTASSIGVFMMDLSAIRLFPQTEWTMEIGIMQ